MNATTWIISPNWLAWGLLGLASVSLFAIALRICIPRTHQPSYSQNRAEAVAWVAIAVSIFALLGVKLSSTVATTDSNLITALGIMVTLLVTWQIWQTIMSRREVDKATQAADNLEKIREELNRTKEVAEGHAWRGEANHLYNSEGEGLTAFHAYIEAACHYIIGQADYTSHINLVLSRIQDVINFGTASLGRQHWVITHEREVDNDIDNPAAAISTMEERLTEARGRLSEIRMLIRTIRQINNVN